MKKFLFLVFFFYSLPSRGIISYSLHENSSGHKVLVTGDCHDSQLDNVCTKHIDLTQQYVSFCRNKYKNECTIVCEGGTDFIEGKPTSKANLLKEFKKRENEFSKMNVPVEFIDDRPEQSAILNGFFSKLSPLYYLKKNEIPKELNLLKDHLYRKFYYKDVKDYIIASQKIVKKMIIDEPNNEYKRELQKILHELIDARNAILSEFSTVQDNEKFHSVILSRLNADSIENLWAGINKFHKFFLRNFDCKVADAGFLAKIFVLERKKQNVLFFIGASHEKQLLKRLKSTNYLCIGKENYSIKMGESNIFKFLKGYLEGYCFSLTYLLTKEDKIKTLEKINQAVTIAEEQRMTSLCKKCRNSAEEKNLKKLQVCTQCKIAKYCSKECQKKDWPIHSSHCLYIKDKKKYKEQVEQTKKFDPINHCEVCLKTAKDLQKKNLLQCSKCKEVKYCSIDCQKTDWNYHKQICVKI